MNEELTVHWRQRQTWEHMANRKFLLWPRVNSEKHSRPFEAIFDNVEKPTMLRNERELRSGIGIVIRLGFFCYTHLIAQRDNIVAYTILQPLRGSKPQKLSNSLNSSSRSNIEWN